MNNDNELHPSTGEGMQPTIGDVPVGRMQTERPEANEPTDGATENVTTQQEVTTAKEDTANAVETVAPPAPPRKDNGCLLAVLGALWWIIKFIFRKWRFTLAVLLLAALGYVGYRVKKVYFDGEGLFATTPAIDTTPEEIRALRNIGQWEALSVDTEELVEKNENSLLSSKQMVCVYRGTLRLGIDMAKVTDKWCNVQGKTVTLHLPEVELLDNEFINDTRTTVFVQEGNWSADTKQQMRTQAAEAMKKRALSAENLSLARRNAEAQFRQLFTALGYDEVNIVFGDGQNE